jgi:ATP-binding cassette, subfamily C (CFTR/MRP), member 1
MFSCFDPITGGRVKEIVKQQNKTGCSWCLPSSEEEDKFEKFCDSYKGFIKVSSAYDTFFEKWERAKSKLSKSSREGKKKPNILLGALVSSFWGDLLKAFIGKITWSILVIFSIWYFVFEILAFIKAKDKGEDISPVPNYEFILCGAFFATMILLSIGIQQMGIYSSILGCKVKAALTTSIFKKMIVRDSYDSKADIVALVAVDVAKISEACLSLQYLWSGIFETLAVLVVLSLMIKASVVPAIAVMAVFLPLQYYLGLVVAYRKKALSVVSTKRTTLMEEILRSIKLIKIYGWEASFFKNINQIRLEEKKMIANINIYQSVIYGLIFSLPPLVSCAVFGTQEAVGSIEPVLVFTTLSFFNTLRVPFSKLPKSLRDVLDALAAMERVQDLLLEPELHPELEHEKAFDSRQEASKGIIFSKASFSYGATAQVVLTDINLNVPAGSLMMVAGPVASGKSNLLKSILGDLTLRGGSSSESHSRAYVPQVPWTALGTVRQNITFGKPYDESWYNQVVHACALEPDFKLMPEGDLTWIGERGGNLSGGQKQRIALARAAYSKASLYVLDSPLSAVDMYTCQHIFKFCIQDIMIAGGGTVVLATHQTELFPMSNVLVVMQNGKQVYCDKYRYSGVKKYFPNLVETPDEVVDHDHKLSSKQMTLVTNQRPRSSKELKPKLSMPLTYVLNPDASLEKKQPSVYSWYFGKMGWCVFGIATLIFVIGQILRVYSDSWVSTWSKRKYKDEGYDSDAFYAGLYGLTVGAFICVSFLRAIWYYYAGRTAANNIHDSAFARVLNAPMHFFHVTPIGKLLAFFTKDIATIDDVLVDNMLLFFIMFWILILALGVVTYNLPIFLAIAVGLGVVYVVIVRQYIRSFEPMMTASSAATGQVIAHTAETLSGLAVVRAFHQQDNFLRDNLGFQSRTTVVSFSVANLSLWLAFRVDIIGSLLVLLCCLLAMLSDIDAADAGLIVSNSFQILLFFSVMSRFMGEVHENMTAVDQARKMCEVDQEEEAEVEEETPAHWPNDGEIEFDRVVMPYLPGKPPVLKGISFKIRPQEKIGVVGRTGAGKSSLIVALYRLAKIKRGHIEVDGVDCGNIGLHNLRSSMAIIPQEPVMFGGTLRSNLDPFDEHSDEDLMDVLNKCLLGPLVKSSKEGLYAPVDSMGANFSLGTQQLICLARAMLNPSRILLLDEATAALDAETNTKVSLVLQEHFSDRTIFTIAHRLDTIIDSDRILTVSAGVVAEYDHPDVLIQDPKSVFHELCMNTGEAQFAALSEKAKKSAKHRLWKDQFKASTGRDFLVRERSGSDLSIGTFDSSS